ncbi:MAG: response regulator transcription factor [Clostridium sp.]
MRILVVEDEQDLLETITEGLRLDGYAVDMCDNGEDALELVFTENYDLIVLDLNLPKMDGIEVLTNIRKFNKDIKVLILTARSHICDKVIGLDLGANDYLTKPFHFQELEARIRSLLRRKFIQQDSVLTCCNIIMNTASRVTIANDVEVNLTRKETSLLEYFLLNQERVISVEELIEHVWDGSVDSFSNAIRVHIVSLRKKLRAILDYDPIKTRIGEGYIINERN